MLTEKEKIVIKAMCRNNLNAAAAARDLYYTRNGISYHINSILDKTGLDPRTFMGALELLNMINEED